MNFRSVCYSITRERHIESLATMRFPVADKINAIVFSILFCLFRCLGVRSTTATILIMGDQLRVFIEQICERINQDASFRPLFQNGIVFHPRIDPDNQAQCIPAIVVNGTGMDLELLESIARKYRSYFPNEMRKFAISFFQNNEEIFCDTFTLD